MAGNNNTRCAKPAGGGQRASLGKSTNAADPANLRRSLGQSYVELINALKEIRAQLVPFLRVLREHSKQSGSAKPNDGDGDRDTSDTPSTPWLSPHKRAEAQAAVALAVGTLRHMGRRLQGLKQDDSLRKELDKTRKLIVLLRKEEAGDGHGGERDNTGITSKRKESVGPNERLAKKPRR